MKLLTLSFNNLNSLKGHWHIDFTHQDFNDGIFAIIGKTGSGKTTILDAICLAIYGRTPRIKEITSAQNDIMSMDQGDCHAQVQLEMDGKMYRFFWGQHRARHKAGGNLQAIKREISEIAHIHDNDAKPLDLKKQSDFNDKAIEILHMDFEQFTRSVMLTQGKFNAFLQADLDNKGKMLEQITGTEIYGEIGKKAHEINREKQNEINALNEQIGNQSLMSDDEFSTLTTQISQLNHDISHHKQHLISTENAISQLIQQNDLQININNLQNELANKQTALTNFTPQLEILTQGKKAKTLQTPYQALISFDDKINDITQHIHDLNNQKQQKQQALTQSHQQKQSLLTSLQNAKQDYQTALPLFKEIKTLDNELYAYRLKIDNTDREKSNLSQSLAVTTNSLQQLKNEYTQKQHQLHALQQNLGEAINHSQLAQDIGILSQSYQALNGLVNDSQTLKNTLIQKQNHQQALNKEHEHLISINAQKQTALQQKQDEQRDLIKIINKLLNSDDYDDSLFLETLSKLQSDMDNHNALFTHFNHLQALYQSNEQLQQKHTDNQTQLKDSKQKHTQRQHTLNELSKKLETQKSKLQNLQQQKQALQQNLNIQAYFDTLQDNCPCPLCGSLTHPYKQNGKPHELNTHDLTQLDSEIIHAQDLLNKIHDNFNKEQRQYDIDTHHIDTLQIKEQELSAQLDSLTQKLIIHHKNNISPLVPDFDSINLSEHSIQYQLEILQQQKQHLEQVYHDFYRHEQTNKQLNAELQALKQDKDAQQQKILTSEQILNQLHREITLDNHQLNTLTQKISDVIDSSNQKWQNYGLSAITNHYNFNEALALFAQNLNELSNQEKQRQTALNEQHTLNEQLTTLNLKIDNEQRNQFSLIWQLSQLEFTLNELQQAYQVLYDKRFALFADKDTEHEQDRLITAVNECQEHLDNLNNAFNQDNEQLLKITQALDINQQHLINLQNEQQSAQQSFYQALYEQGFNDLHEFLSASLDDDALNELANTEQSLTLAIQVNKQQLAQAQESYNTLSQKITNLDKTLDAYQKDKQHLQKLVDDTLTTLGEKNERLKQETTLRENNAQLLKILNDKKQEAQIWQRLNGLIGSHDGKIYRSFVQGLTLKMVLHHANDFLAKINDRYVLYHDTNSKDPLDISIIDTHQGSEKRSTKNLSGGESFIVSLALAMGLSMINSENIRIDSLFLDEGFGTLDNDALDVVLSTLSSLNETGKTIAIISHIPALNEQIRTQIMVHKLGSGSSRLSGCGVSQIKEPLNK